MTDWIYILNPNKDTLDGEPSDKETMRRLAEEEPELDLWFSRRNRMEQGDRLWFFFTDPESAVAAVAEVEEEPRNDTAVPDVSYLVRVTLLTEATRALYRAPVPRDELGLGQVRSVQKVKPEALPVLLARADLRPAERRSAVGCPVSQSGEWHVVRAPADHRGPGRPELGGDRAADGVPARAGQGGAGAGGRRRGLPLHDARLLPKPHPRPGPRDRPGLGRHARTSAGRVGRLR